jgi:signal transduction histidine kinase
MAQQKIRADLILSSEREFLEAWVEDKEERRWLGTVVKSKMAEAITELEQQIRELKREKAKYERAEQALTQVHEIMRRAGLNVNYNWLEELERALRFKVPPYLLSSLEIVEREVERIKSLVNQNNLGVAG